MLSTELPLGAYRGSLSVPPGTGCALWLRVGCSRHWFSEAHKDLAAFPDHGAKEERGNSV